MSEGNATISPFTKPVGYPLAVCPGKYMSNDDYLVMDVWCSVASVVVEFTGLFLTTEGAYIPFQVAVSPTSDRAITTGTLKLTEGFLLHLQARASSGTVRRGQCFVKAALQRGAISNAMRHTTLLSNYVSLNDEVVYPGSRMLSSVEGPGIVKLVTGTNPAAGSEISETVPTNALWRLYSIFFSFAVANSGAAREVRLSITNGTTEFYEHNMTLAAPINATTVFILGEGQFEQTAAQNTRTANSIPRFLLPQGSVIRTETDAIVAGDDYSAPQMYVEEWIEE